MSKSGVFLAILLVATAIAPVLAASQNVVVDNPSATFSGTWATASAATNKYGSDYRTASLSPSNGSTATYTPDLPVTASDWQVFTWYPTVSGAGPSVQFTIHHAGGDTVVPVAQNSNAGTWVSLGTYTMNAGTGNYVRISNVGSNTTKKAIADAVRFYSASGGDSTPPVITNVAATPGPGSATVTWTTDEPATSQVEYGTTTAYGSLTTEDSTLVTSHSVTFYGQPTTLYHYRVISRDATGNPATSGDYTVTTLAQAPELRAIWANTWNAGSILNSTEVSNLVNTTYDANYNMIIPEIRKCGDAYYVSHPVYSPTDNMWFQEHKATNINDADPNFDPLQDCVTKAHAVGMQVNAWIVAYRIWNSGWGTPPTDHVWYRHRPGGTGTSWAMMKSDLVSYADGSNYNLDPGVPGVQDYICKIVMDIVNNYDIDGFNYDYIRYPAYYWGYNQITRQRFYDEYGFWPPTSNTDTNWPTWAGFLRRQVTDLVRKCYLEIMASKPWINHNVDTVGWSGADPCTDFEGTRQYKEVNQDSEAWMQEHIIDMNLLMNYKREYDSAQGPDYDLWTDWLAEIQAQYGRWSMDGQACYLNSIADSCHQMLVAREHGVAICNYDFLTTNKDGQPASAFFDAVRTNVYPTKAPIPTMPWKTNPTDGIIFGTVTNAAKPNDPVYWNWIYKATVTATGPVTRTVQTDATGTYGFVSLPPGAYTITVSKPGFPTRSYTNQVLAAGQVLRENFDLGYTTCTSPAGAVSAGWNLVSLPLEPANADPISVFNGINIDNHLYKWDNPTQSLTPYDSWDPGNFGSVSTTDGYWLETPTAAAISYQAYADTAANRDIAIPTAGWSIIGCPFLSDKWWPDVQVTRAGERVSLATAANTNGWLSATGWWWDSASQSLVDLGLPEFFPASEYLQPWHGYWVQTNVNDLTLTVR